MTFVAGSRVQMGEKKQGSERRGLFRRGGFWRLQNEQKTSETAPNPVRACLKRWSNKNPNPGGRRTERKKKKIDGLVQLVRRASLVPIYLSARDGYRFGRLNDGNAEDQQSDIKPRVFQIDQTFGVSKCGFPFRWAEQSQAQDTHLEMFTIRKRSTIAIKHLTTDFSSRPDGGSFEKQGLPFELGHVSHSKVMNPSKEAHLLVDLYS